MKSCRVDDALFPSSLARAKTSESKIRSTHHRQRSLLDCCLEKVTSFRLDISLLLDPLFLFSKTNILLLS
jgi:hypothetical protein